MKEDKIKASEKAACSLINFYRRQIELSIADEYLKIRTKCDDDVMKLLIEGKVEEAISLMDKLSEMEQRLLNVLAEYTPADDTPADKE